MSAERERSLADLRDWGPLGERELGHVANALRLATRSTIGADASEAARLLGYARRLLATVEAQHIELEHNEQTIDFYRHQVTDLANLEENYDVLWKASVDLYEENARLRASAVAQQPPRKERTSTGNDLCAEIDKLRADLILRDQQLHTALRTYELMEESYRSLEEREHALEAENAQLREGWAELHRQLGPPPAT